MCVEESGQLRLGAACVFAVDAGLPAEDPDAPRLRLDSAGLWIAEGASVRVDIAPEALSGPETVIVLVSHGGSRTGEFLAECSTPAGVSARLEYESGRVLLRLGPAVGTMFVVR
jgi:hypothetical protein